MPSLIYILVAAGAIGLYVALPKTHGRNVGIGVLLGAVGLIMAFAMFRLPELGAWTQVLFWVFSGMTLASAAAMITSVNPIYSALWFALAVLNVCGLFLLRDAEFLAAATVIVYAGAIVVTFLFVIMLAQQRGGAAYDRTTREPALGVLASFVILGAMLLTLVREKPLEPTPAPVTAVASTTQPAAQQDEDPGHVFTLGMSLINTHLISLELAGVLLLVALVGATAVVSIREEKEKSDSEEPSDS